MDKMLNRYALTSFLFMILSIPGCIDRDNGTESGNIRFDELEHSYISLMPEGEPEDLSTYLPLSPSVVAWGNDPRNRLDQPQKIREKMTSYYDLGIKLQAVNVWMLTMTARHLYEHPEYQDATCLDIEGNHITPRWLDSEYKGVKSYWGCTNHPLFRENLIQRATAGITGGANILHLDDHLGTFAAADHSGGCFCNHCMEGFRDWLHENYSVQDLVSMGIEEIGSFNYREFVRSSGSTTLDEYMAAKSRGNIPLLEEFLTFQRESAADFVSELGSIADSIAGKSIPLGVNSWNLIPGQLATSHYADYFSNEVSHYNVEDLIPPMCYLLGNALGKPVFSTGTGEDWIQINHNPAPVRVQRWIATAYAFGNYFMYSWNKWGFSEETGTLWTRIPVSYYELFCSFITENSGLFDDYEAIGQVGILYDNTACRNGNWEVREICRELHYANIPIGLIVSGDEFLQFHTTQEQLEQFELIIVPGSTDLNIKGQELLEPMIRDDKVITWKNPGAVSERIKPFISLKNTEKVWAIPRIKSGSSGESVVIHLLNQDYDASKDKMILKENVEIFISDKLIGNSLETRIKLYAPGQPEKTLEFKPSRDGINITLPLLNLWAIIKI